MPAMKQFLTLLIAFLTLNATAQNVGDYNSAGSGPWNAASTWLRFNGTDFVAAPSAPTSSDGQVVILPGHTVTASTAVSIDELFVAGGATLITTAGTFTVVNGPGTDMSVLGSWQLSGATIEGPGTILIGGTGAFAWTNGNLGATSIIDLQSGSMATYNTTGNNASSLGIINNAGIWNMEGGVMGQLADMPTGPKTFNNLSGGVLNLINWFSSTPWRMVTNNQGTINKNSGTNQFTFSNTFGPNPFANLPGSTVNLGAGNLAISAPEPVQSGTFNLANGTTLFIPDVNYTGPGIVNNGTISTGEFRFQGATAQTLEGTGNIAFLAIDNAAGVDLGGDQTVTNTLTLTSGQLRLGDHDLLLQSTLAAALSGGSNTSWVRTNGAGSLRRQAVNGPSYRFPVGTANYAPLLMILMNAPQETFSVRVQEGVSTEYGAPGTASGQNITSDAVGLTWLLEEQNPGGHTVNMAVDWNAGDELPLFNRSACRVSYYDGTNWVAGTTGAATGTGPYTRSYIGLTNFRELCVSDTDADLNGISTTLPEPVDGLMKVYPMPAHDMLFIDLPAGHGMHSLMLFDASGREVMRSTANSGERLAIPMDHLRPGIHMLVLIDAQGQCHQHRVSIVH